MAVEYHVRQYKETYLEAIMAVAVRLGLEPDFDSEQIRELIDPTLQQKLFVECVKNNVVKGEISTQLDL